MARVVVATCTPPDDENEVVDFGVGVMTPEDSTASAPHCLPMQSFAPLLV